MCATSFIVESPRRESVFIIMAFGFWINDFGCTLCVTMVWSPQGSSFFLCPLASHFTDIASYECAWLLWCAGGHRHVLKKSLYKGIIIITHVVKLLTVAELRTSCMSVLIQHKMSHHDAVDTFWTCNVLLCRLTLFPYTISYNHIQWSKSSSSPSPHTCDVSGPLLLRGSARRGHSRKISSSWLSWGSQPASQYIDSVVFSAPQKTQHYTQYNIFLCVF